MSHFVWDTLGIDPTNDVRSIKRAYAARLKQKRPEDDAEAFQRLRQAYQWALQWAEDESSDNVTSISSPAIPASDLASRRLPTDVTGIEAESRGHDEFQSASALEVSSNSAKKVSQTIEVVRHSLMKGEAAAIMAFDTEVVSGQYSFAEREALEIALLHGLASCLPLPVDLTLHIAQHFGWLEPHVQQLLYRNQEEATSKVLPALFAELQQREWDRHAAEDATTRRALALLLTEMTRWQRLRVKLDASVHQRIADLLYLIPQTSPHYWQKIRDLPSVKWWQANDHRPHISQNEGLFTLCASLVGFFVLLVGKKASFIDATLAFAGVLAGTLTFIWGVNLVDAWYSAKPSLHLKTLAVLLILQATSFVLLLTAPSLNGLLLPCVGALWITTLIAIREWGRARESLFQRVNETTILVLLSSGAVAAVYFDKIWVVVFWVISLISTVVKRNVFSHLANRHGALILLLLWVFGLAAAMSVHDGWHVFAMLLSSWGLYSLASYTHKFHLSAKFGALFGAPLTAVHGSLLVASVVAVLLVYSRETTWLGALLATIVIAQAAIWDTPRVKWATGIRIVSGVAVLIFLLDVVRSLPEMTSLGKYVLMTLTVMIGSNCVVTAAAWLGQRRQSLPS